ncbi:MAG: hypothetical protein ACE5GZ_00465 [Gammaproteobacteria bacterium]
MGNRLNSSWQIGQSMVEYTIVLVFGVLALTTGPSGDVMQDLLKVIKQNYEGYSYGISLSELPDFDSATEYKNALKQHGVPPQEIDRLAVETSKLYPDLKPYNKDPVAQLKKLQSIKKAKKQLQDRVKKAVRNATSII